MQSPRTCRFNVLAALVAMFAAQIVLADTAPSEDLESTLRDELVTAVMTAPLQGVWVNVKREEGMGFELDVIVDSQPEIEKAQLAELNRVVKSIVKTAKFKFTNIERLPFEKLVSELRLDVELGSEFAGAAVDGAYFTAESSDEVIVMLTGRVRNDSQRDRLSELCQQKMHKLFVGSTTKIEFAKTKPEKGGEGVIDFQPAEEVGYFCFNLATEQFSRGDYALAYRTFTEAHLAAPSRIDIQYWRVVSLLGSDRESDAKRLLQGLVEAARKSKTIPTSGAVYRSLERVQGPLRRRLIALENTLYCKSCN